MADEPRIPVANDELFTVREGQRGMNRIIESIEAGDIEKAVLTRSGKMVAIVMTIEDFVALKDAE